MGHRIRVTHFLGVDMGGTDLGTTEYIGGEWSSGQWAGTHCLFILGGLEGRVFEMVSSCVNLTPRRVFTHIDI